MQIYTIGHSNHDKSTFLSMLHDNHIEVLADIRSFPGSRHNPQYNKELMPVWIKPVIYTHIPKLGGRRRIIKDVDYNLVSAWINPSFGNYAAYTLTNDFHEGLNQLIRIAQGYRVAYMCSELCHKRCHRWLVIDQLTSLGIEVIHIEPDKQNQIHKINSMSKQKDGKLIYPLVIEPVEFNGSVIYADNFGQMTMQL